MSNDVIEMNDQPRAIVAATPSQLLQIAIEKGTDMAQLEKLMDLQERYEANQARKEYVKAMAEFKRNSPDIYKDKEVAFSGTYYTHASLGNICEVVTQSLANHGLSHRWHAEQQDNKVKVTCIITHVLGHSESTSLEAKPDDSGKKNSIQQIASTVTYLQRYTLLAATGLAVKDMLDDDGKSSEPEKEKAKPPLTDKGFVKALEAIKAGKVTALQVKADYTLTADQDIAISDAKKESA